MAARPAQISDAVRSLGDLDPVDYEYACALDPVPGNHPAERWARAVFEGAPQPARSVTVAGWRLVLRLRLAPRSSPAHVLGWTILVNEPQAIVLSADSPLLTARIVVQAQDARVVHTTLVRLRSRLGHLVWALATPVHQLTIPFLLNHAAAELRTQ